MTTTNIIRIITCDFCNKQINPGEKYVRLSVMKRGSAYRIITRHSCEKCTNKLFGENTILR